jgi:ribosomal-protein-serine acetyltransferase
VSTGKQPTSLLPVDDAVVLKPLDEWDPVPLYSLVQANRATWGSRFAWAEAQRSVGDARAYFRNMRRQYLDGRGCHWGLWEHGQLRGGIIEQRLDWANRATSLCYYLDGAAQNRGVMTRACRTLIGHAFAVQGLHRVEIRVPPDNTRGRALPERLGFRQEAVLRGACYRDGTYLDLVVYGLLAADWRE